MSWVIRKLERWGGHPPRNGPALLYWRGLPTNDGTRFVSPIVTGPRDASRRPSLRSWDYGEDCPVRRPKKTTRCLDAHCPCPGCRREQRAREAQATA